MSPVDAGAESGESCLARLPLGLAEDDPDLVRCAVVLERDRGTSARQHLSVELRRCHPETDALRVLYDDLVSGGVVAEVDLVARPGAGDARIEQQRRAAQTESQDPLDAGLVHPARGPRV